MTVKEPRRRTLEVARRPESLLPSLSGRRVLIADDDAALVKLVRTSLSRQGYTFLEASNGNAALTLVRQEKPDLLLLDVEMPDLGGVEVCRIVKANPGEGGFGFVPIILMTARRGGKVEGLELGADDYLIKPFDMLELSARVKSMLRLKVLQDALVDRNKELDRVNRELEHKRAELLELSRTDGLTGLYNRRHFEERLEAEFSRAQRYRAPLSCLLLDIDHFKKVNDTHGHPVGDLVLREVAQVARRMLRDVDVIARYGGEELIALLPETGPEDAAQVAERIRASVAALRLTGQAQPASAVRVTCSIGLATYPAEAIDSGEALVQVADQCLYSAKNGGRNQVRAL